MDAWLNNDWTEVANGTTVGYKRLVYFPEIESNRVRVRILNARVCPTLAEFGLFLQPPVETFGGAK